jgi:hypothetical protein
MFQLLSSSSKALASIAFILCCAVFASAQQTTGAISGDVKDQNGAVITGATVTAKSLETGLTLSTVSDREGRYIFPSLPVGVYSLSASQTGFTKISFEGIKVAVAEITTHDIALQPAGVLEDITVTDTLGYVNTQTSELSFLVNERAIRELPLNGRNYTDLAFLQPGVISYPHRDGGSVVAHGIGASINGQDPRSNVYLLDGTPQNDFTNGPAGSAAGTALGIETIREFRVEVNTYSAEYGRNSGGQVNIVSKSGTNNFHGSLYLFHRNDNLDARNFFDGAKKPEFKRNQYGGSIGGPIKQDKLFFFFGYEALKENLGKTITTVVPDLNARMGILPGVTGVIPISPAVRPYLDQFPLPNGPNRGQGLANYIFGFNQQINQHFVQGRIDYNRSTRDQFFGRYTFDDADQELPTDFPQFPRTFISRNQFFTGEYRQTLSPNTFNTFRLGFSRTRIGQNVTADVPSTLQPFIAGRDIMGDIDIGGIPRFGPQSSGNLRLTQNVFGFEYGLVHNRGRHLIKAGALAEYYQDNMFNPTFSLGIFTFSSLADFLQARPQRFIGLPSTGALDRYWRFTLFGFYLHDTVRINSRLTVNAGLRYEVATMPEDINGRDSALINFSDRVPTVGQLYLNPTTKNISPRAGFAWDIFGDGKTSLRGGYGVFFNTNNQQNLIVTVTNPPATPRIIIANPPVTNISFPVPNLNTGSNNSIRPVQWDLDNPYIQVWNLNLQRELWFDTVVTLGYAGSRGIHLLRSGDVNTPVPIRQADGTPFYPVGAPRPNTAFTTIELKSSDGNSWYNALIFELRKRLTQGLTFQSSYTFSRNIDTTQASTFFSDATNGTTSAFPEPFGLQYNKGLADYHAKHNWVLNFTWEVPFARNLEGMAKTILDGWQLSGITQVRSGQPLTVFVQRNRSRSLWSPSLSPGVGLDRPNISQGFTHQSAVTGDPNNYFAPGAFSLQPGGYLGSLGRGALIGPNLRTFDLSAIKNTRWARLGENTVIQLRLEAFNLFNRANFASPSLIAFSGAANGEPALSTFGQIRSTVTSSRQVQLGLRITF